MQTERYPSTKNMPLESATTNSVKYTNQLPLIFIVYLFLLAPKIDFIFTMHCGVISVILISGLSATKGSNLLKVSKALACSIFIFTSIGLYYIVVAILQENSYADFLLICISINISIAFGWMAAKYLAKKGVKVDEIIDRLLVICTLVAVINSLIILLEFLFPDFKSLIESALQQNSTGLIYAQHPFQLRGFASAGGAGLSIFNAVAIMVVIHLVRDNMLRNWVAIVFSLIIIFANIFIGRTGLIISIALFLILQLVIAYKLIKSGWGGGFKLVIGFFILIMLFNIIGRYEMDLEVTEWAFEWVNGLGNDKSLTASSDDLKTMIYIPENIFHLLFGVGFFEGSNSIYMRTDSGYLKTILSIGLLLSFFLYTTIIYLFYKVYLTNRKYLMLVFSIIGIMLVVEIKEPFFYQNFCARLIFLLSGGAMFIASSRSVYTKRLEAGLLHIDNWTKQRDDRKIQASQRAGG